MFVVRKSDDNLGFWKPAYQWYLTTGQGTKLSRGKKSSRGRIIHSQMPFTIIMLWNIQNMKCNGSSKSANQSFLW